MNAKIEVNANRVLSDVSPYLFGHFMENAFDNVYGGAFDPGNPLSNANGHRLDVLEAMKRAGASILRYPGGNFVSNYHWEDGVGPKEQRKRVFEYAWLTEESNQHGTLEFIELCRAVGAEPLLCVNMGSGTAEEAMHWVEYCNGTGNTEYANLRRSHGYEEPFGVKFWGLGNEMYGDWQMGALSAEDYAKKAVDFARAMKFADPAIQLIISGYDTDWNYTAVKALANYADYISAHSYSAGWNTFDPKDHLLMMSLSEKLQVMNDLLVANIRSGANTSMDSIKITWDEWNMFGWQIPDVEKDETYTLQNAVYTASVLNFFLRNSETVRMAHYSTFININGAVRVMPGSLLLRPQFYSFEMIANNVGSKLLDCFVQSDTFEVDFTSRPELSQSLGRKIPFGAGFRSDSLERSKTRSVSYIDAVATADEGAVYLNVVNKHAEEDIWVDVELTGTAIHGQASTWTALYHDDLYACNTIAKPDTVKPFVEQGAALGNHFRILARKHSVNVIRLAK